MDLGEHGFEALEVLDRDGAEDGIERDVFEGKLRVLVRVLHAEVGQARAARELFGVHAVAFHVRKRGLRSAHLIRP